jgi:hypothetical protein
MIGLVIAAVALAAAGLAVFIYGDVVGYRPGRTAGVVLTTFAVIVFAVLAARLQSRPRV